MRTHYIFDILIVATFLMVFVMFLKDMNVV
jgi:hypothetical protein